MDENYQDKTESKLTATEDKSTPSSLSPQDQRGADQLQNNQMEDTIKQLRDHGYKVTEEYSNTGQLSKVSGESPLRKTRWDWAQLLIIPFLIFFVGIGFTWAQNQTSNQIAKDNRAQDLQIANDQQQEAMLKAYLGDMMTLLLDKKLGSQAVADKAVSAEAVTVARARTLVTLRSLNVVQPMYPNTPIPLIRKGIILQFLYEAGLISKGKVIVNLDGADLTYTYLPKAQLNLSEIDLSHSDLLGAMLSTAVLKGANLTGASLAFADLTGTDLTGADLTGTSLQQAILDFANLTGATVSQQQLMTTTSHIGMTCPNGLKSRPSRTNELPCS